MNRERGLVADAAESATRLLAETEALTAQITGREELKTNARATAEQSAASVASAESALEAETTALSTRDGERARLSRTLADLENRVRRLDGDLARILSERAAIAPSAEEEAQLAQAQAHLDRAAQDLSQIEKDTLAAESARTEAEAKERFARDPLQGADREVSVLKAEAEAIARLLRIDGSDLWPPVVDTLKVSPGYEVALGAALGDDLDVPADEAAPIHWRTLPPLESAPALPSGVRPLSDYVTAPEALARRLSQIGLVASAEEGRTLQASGSGLSPRKAIFSVGTVSRRRRMRRRRRRSASPNTTAWRSSTG